MALIKYPQAICLVVLTLLFVLQTPSADADQSSALNNSTSKAREVPIQHTGGKLIIGYSGCAPSTDFWNKLTHSLREQALQEDIVIVDFSAEDFSLVRQKNNVQQAIDMQVDGMIIGAVSDGLEDTITLLEQKNIPVVTVGVPIEHKWITTHVGTSSFEAASIGAIHIQNNISRFSEGRRIIIISGDKDQENSRIRGNTPARILSDAGYHVTVHFSEDWSGTEALKHALREFSTQPEEISAVFTTFEPASIAMVEAAEKYKLNALLVGFDWSDTMRQMLIDGRLHAAITQNPARIGREGLKALVGMLRDKQPPLLIDVPPVLITKENVEAY